MKKKIEKIVDDSFWFSKYFKVQMLFDLIARSH